MVCNFFHIKPLCKFSVLFYSLNVVMFLVTFYPFKYLWMFDLVILSKGGRRLNVIHKLVQSNSIQLDCCGLN